MQLFVDSFAHRTVDDHASTLFLARTPEILAHRSCFSQSALKGVGLVSVFSGSSCKLRCYGLSTIWRVWVCLLATSLSLKYLTLPRSLSAVPNLSPLLITASVYVLPLKEEQTSNKTGTAQRNPSIASFYVAWTGAPRGRASEPYIYSCYSITTWKYLTRCFWNTNALAASVLEPTG